MGAKVSNICMLLHVLLESLDLHTILSKKGFNGNMPSLWALQIESRNNKLEMESVNNKELIEVLDYLLKCLGSFDEARMLKNIEACEWLTNAIRSLEVPALDPCYANMRVLAITNPGWQVIHKMKLAGLVDRIGGAWIFLQLT